MKRWVNWQKDYQVRVFWYQVYQAQLLDRMLNRSVQLNSYYKFDDGNQSTWDLSSRAIDVH